MKNICKTEVLEGLGIQVGAVWTPKSRTKRVRIAKLAPEKGNLRVKAEKCC